MGSYQITHINQSVYHKFGVKLFRPTKIKGLLLIFTKTKYFCHERKLRQQLPTLKETQNSVKKTLNQRAYSNVCSKHIHIFLRRQRMPTKIYIFLMELPIPNFHMSIFYYLSP